MPHIVFAIKLFFVLRTIICRYNKLWIIKTKKGTFILEK